MPVIWKSWPDTRCGMAPGADVGVLLARGKGDGVVVHGAGQDTAPVVRAVTGCNSSHVVPPSTVLINACPFAMPTVTQPRFFETKLIPASAPPRLETHSSEAISFHVRPPSTLASMSIMLARPQHFPIDHAWLRSENVRTP